MKQRVKRSAAALMAVCTFAAACPAALIAQAATYPGDQNVYYYSTSYQRHNGGSANVVVSRQNNSGNIWMVDKNRNIRVINSHGGSYHGMGPFVVDYSDKTPIRKQDCGSKWNARAEMMDNVEKVWDYFRYTLNVTDFNFSGSGDSAIYVSEYNKDADARSETMYGMNFIGFGEEGSLTYNMGVDRGAVGHEFAHLLTMKKMGWNTSMNMQTYALMEAYSDILGELSEDNPDWKVAANVFKNSNQGYSLRDLANPGATNNPLQDGYYYYYDNYTSFMSNLIYMQDQGTYPAYYGSTVVSHAAYLMYTGGISKYDLARIWCNSLDYYSSYPSDAKLNASFMDCRDAVIYAAQDYFGSNSDWALNIIKNAFDAVDITPHTTMPEFTQGQAPLTHDMASFVTQEKIKFPTGKYWTTGNPDTCGNTPVYDDHSTFVPMGPTVYYGFGSIGWQDEEEYFQCAGFAKKVQMDRYHTNMFTQDDRASSYTPKAGDHLRLEVIYKGHLLSEHSVFVTAANSSTLTYAECNYDGNNRIRWDQSASWYRDENSKVCFSQGSYTYRFVWVERAIPVGDTNADGAVTSADRTMMNALINNSASTHYVNTIMRRYAADINRDGWINNDDLVLLNKLISNTSGIRSYYGFIK
ncbi:MAG: M4 family metallopeptidase [Oscillospiraceae bacterium]|nr:M4 family metallopeptidase [Oscillospiraceae bacterium]